MQGEKFRDFQFERQQISFNILDDILCFEERKINTLPEIKQDEDLSRQKKNPLRGKGRPKGEKNFKGASRKNKESLNDENRRKGHWSLEQNKRYHWFLEIYHNHFICKQMRRQDKIFKTMATFIGTREAQQCRSHHQKMQKKYHTFGKILLFLRKSHYGTEETAPILEDMNKSEVYETSVLLESKELNDYLQIQRVNPQSQLMLQQEKQGEIMEVDKFLDLQDNNFNTFDDILGDNYELHLGLQNLLL